MNTLAALDSLLACSVCLGAKDGQVMMASNMAIGFMVLVVFGTLGGFLKFIHYLAQRERLAAEEPDYLEDLTRNSPTH